MTPIFASLLRSYPRKKLSCLLSSAGQSSALVMRGSAVRIRQEALHSPFTLCRRGIFFCLIIMNHKAIEVS